MAISKRKRNDNTDPTQQTADNMDDPEGLEDPNEALEPTEAVAPDGELNTHPSALADVFLRTATPSHPSSVSADDSVTSFLPLGTVIKLPQKRYYRQRAHANPLADHELD